MLTAWRLFTQARQSRLANASLALALHQRSHMLKHLTGWRVWLHGQQTARQHALLALQHHHMVTRGKAFRAWHKLARHSSQLRDKAAGK